ncbi:hypothetical protein INTERNEXUS_170 [Bacillus phage vB_BspM_Internexus]|nr:hypothetical protein INTERNEXUS_170 [Bacillus phage vB_BspM_Internexus]
MRLIVENAVKEGTKKAITYGAAIVGGGIASAIIGKKLSEKLPESVKTKLSPSNYVKMGNIKKVNPVGFVKDKFNKSSNEEYTESEMKVHLPETERFEKDNGIYSSQNVGMREAIDPHRETLVRDTVKINEDEEINFQSNIEIEDEEDIEVSEEEMNSFFDEEVGETEELLEKAEETLEALKEDKKSDKKSNADKAKEIASSKENKKPFYEEIASKDKETTKKPVKKTNATKKEKTESKNKKKEKEKSEK